MKKLLRSLLMLIFLMMISASAVFAAELGAPMNSYTTEESISLFIRNPGSEPDHVYIGNDECTDFSVGELGSMRTVIVLDNSLSIPEGYRDGIKNFLKNLVAARNDGDIFTIATFAQSVTYIVEDSSDYLDISSKLDALQFEYQESYFTETLYQVITDVSAKEDIRYTRIILIADGNDDQNLGYTDEELENLITEVKIPIYTVGCMSGDNTDNSANLQSMFSLSRLSNGRDYLIDQTGFDAILTDISNDIDIVRLDIRPADDICDGSERPVRITFGENYIQTNIQMPFRSGGVVETTEPTETETETASETETTAAGVEEGEGGSILDNWPFSLMQTAIGAAVILVVIVGVVVLIVLRRKKTPPLTPPQPRERSVTAPGGEDDHDKETLSVRRANKAGGDTAVLGDDTTTLLGGGKSSNAKLHLQDLNDKSITFECPIRGSVLIGRDPQRCQIAITYNRSVSGIHCEVIEKNGSFYVRDGGGSVMHSTNGTFVNDQRATPELPLKEGSTLRLGNASFKVSFK